MAQKSVTSLEDAPMSWWYDKMRRSNEPLNQKCLEWAVAHVKKITAEEQARYYRCRAWDDANKPEK